MGNNTAVRWLMSELGPLLPAEVTEFPGERLWAVTLEDGTALFLDHDSDRDRLVLSAEVGEPGGDGLERVYEALLVFNNQWPSTGGAALALDVPSGRVLQLFDVAVVNLEPIELLGIVRGFVASLQAWRELFGNPAPMGAAGARGRAQQRAGRGAEGHRWLRQLVDREHGAGTAERLLARVSQQVRLRLHLGDGRRDPALLRRAAAMESRQQMLERAAPLLRGAQELIDSVAPRWCANGIAEDGLPELRAATDAEGNAVPAAEVARRGVIDDFARWLRGKAPRLGRGAYMGSLEAVLASAIAGGLLSKIEVEQMYLYTMYAPDRMRALLDELGYGDARDVEWADEPPRPGDILVVDGRESGGGRAIARHAMIADDAGRGFCHDRPTLLGGLVESGGMVRVELAGLLERAAKSLAAEGLEMRVRYLRAHLR
jgi:hypothetical protein